jgi:predicted aspartyl protease
VKILAAALVACALVACTPPAATRSTPADSARPGVTYAAPAAQTTERRSARLHFDRNGRPFPLPLVRGAVAGEPVWMVVDTGANSHVIARWVAMKTGLHLHPLGDVGTDHAGRSMTAYSVEHPRVVIEGWGPLADRPTLVTDVPDAIAGLGIGAFISPQWLGGSRDAIVLDLEKREMHSAGQEEARRELEHREGLAMAPGGVRLCESGGSLVRGLSFVVPAKIEGHDVDLLLDTGAQRTDLLTSSRAGGLLLRHSAPSGEAMYAASGVVHARLVRAAQVTLGQWSFTTDIDLVPGAADPSCRRDGVASMDALASCVLVLSRKEVFGKCSSDGQ